MFNIEKKIESFIIQRSALAKVKTVFSEFWGQNLKIIHQMSFDLNKLLRQEGSNNNLFFEFV